MSLEIKELLERLNGNVEQINKGQAVEKAITAANNSELPDNTIEAKTLDEKYVSPLRKGFETLAKASPSNFGSLGTTQVLDDPYSYLRAKNTDGTYKVPTAQLDLLIRGLATVNDSREAAVAAGASEFNEWTGNSGNPNGAIESRMFEAAERGQFGANNDVIRRALDSTSGAALIRTDLEPVIREAFNRYFPAYEQISKIPSNGLKHTWVQKTSPGTASFVGELGTLSGAASDSTYAQSQSTNIAVAASHRTIGIKAQFASQQSGMNFNLGGLGNNEVTSALQSIANLIQSAIFQGNESQAGGTLANEDGLYNTLGFDGLRTQLKGAGTSITKAAETYLQILKKGVGQLFDGGADLNSILMFLSAGAMNAIDEELQAYLRIIKSDANGAVPTSLGSGGLAMLNGILARPQMVAAGGAQGNGIGYYTFSAAATEDIYLLDPNGITLPYLGSPTPTIIQLPLGTTGTLSNVFIPFCMMGLAVYVKNFNRKIRIPRQVL